MDKLAAKTMELLESCIEDMNKKKDLTPSDLEILCKAYKLRRELKSEYEREELRKEIRRIEAEK